jgi:hypothetical protein
MGLEAKLKDLSQLLDAKIQNGTEQASIQQLSSKIEIKFNATEKKLSEIAEALGIKDKSIRSDAEIIEDRKRLKERLKSGFDSENENSDLSFQINNETWFTYIFGAYSSDGRSGRDSSRLKNASNDSLSLSSRNDTREYTQSTIMFHVFLNPVSYPLLIGLVEGHHSQK